MDFLQFMFSQLLSNVVFGFLYVAVPSSSIAFLLCFVLARQYFKRQKNKRVSKDSIVVGFFHPYCNAGGGGERVLWCAIKAIHEQYPDIKVYVYTGDQNVTPHEIIIKAKNTFNISINKEKVEFVFLKHRYLVEHERYPYFTLLLQSLGSMVFGLEALMKFQPDIFIDTMGYSFTMPIFKYLGQCKIACYVHYPTISTDMLKRIRSRTVAHNNQNIVARNPLLSFIKLMYYKIFSAIYSSTGKCSDSIMVNSTWTQEHINKIWGVPFKTYRIYPPCDVNHLKTLQKTIPVNDSIIIVSIGQFRPEKDHPLQIKAMYELRTLLQNNEDLWKKIKLRIIGSCRDQADLERVQNMKDLTRHLSLEDSIEFKVNASYHELLQSYQEAAIGLHAMWNEHFGIGIVECMAAGLIMVANKSGGPMKDIIDTMVGSQTGFLATSSLDYAHCIKHILSLNKDERHNIQTAARASVERFSETEFENGFLRAMSPLFTK